MTDIEIKELEEKARDKRVTPGPWEAIGSMTLDTYCVAYKSDASVPLAVMQKDRMDLDDRIPNADYIALANPTAILSLITRLREAENMHRFCSQGDVKQYHDKWREPA